MKVDRHEYHIVELNDQADLEVLSWCYRQFGPVGHKTWFERNRCIYFYNAQDHMMFLLRWGS